jgi:hypothetical protein
MKKKVSNQIHTNSMSFLMEFFEAYIWLQVHSNLWICSSSLEALSDWLICCWEISKRIDRMTVANFGKWQETNRELFKREGYRKKTCHLDWNFLVDWWLQLSVKSGWYCWTAAPETGLAMFHCSNDVVVVGSSDFCADQREELFFSSGYNPADFQ